MIKSVEFIGSEPKKSDILIVFEVKVTSSVKSAVFQVKK